MASMIHKHHNTCVLDPHFESHPLGGAFCFRSFCGGLTSLTCAEHGCGVNHGFLALWLKECHFDLSALKVARAHNLHWDRHKHYQCNA